MAHNTPNTLFQIPNWRNINQSGIWEFFSDSALPHSEIPNPQLGTLPQTGDFISQISDILRNWAYFLFVV